MADEGCRGMQANVNFCCGGRHRPQTKRAEVVWRSSATSWPHEGLIITSQRRAGAHELFTLSLVGPLLHGLVAGWVMVGDGRAGGGISLCVLGHIIPLFQRCMSPQSHGNAQQACLLAASGLMAQRPVVALGFAAAPS